MNHLQDTKVLVLGLGTSGLAMARWCARCGAEVRVWDSREAPANAAALAAQVPTATWMRGPLTDEAFAGVHLVLKSPGLSPQDERIAGPLNRAADSGVLVQGELELFARALADLKSERGYAPKVLAITGTNGKTTTTSMAGMLIARTGRRVVVAGNIGPTMLQTLADALDQEPEVHAVPRDADAETAEVMPQDMAPEDLSDLLALDGAAANEVDAARQETPEDELAAEAAGLPVTATTNPDAAEALADDAPQPVFVAPSATAAPVFEFLPDVWVLELSSFQLDQAKSFEPSAAAVLNITQDHLDWHGSMAHYIAAKARVFGKHAVMVINRDDPMVEALVPAPEVVKGGKGRKPVTLAREVVRFGISPPQQPGDYGLVKENGMTWLARARELDDTPRRGRTGKAAEPETLSIQRLMPADALRVRGRHNACNALAALALATAIGCPLAPMLHGLREYAGEPHRVQFIASIDGVDAYDDSKGTNVGATVAALDGLGADKSPAKLVVILGGDGKGQDFAPLVEPVRRHARAVASIGRDAERIEQALKATGVPLQRHASLEAATRWSFEAARPGDAVLLSPACASLDMFRDYADRARVFVAEVQAIAADHGGLAA